MRGEGGEGVRLREDEGREAREGVCVQESESTDMWARGERDSKCPGEGKYRYTGMGGSHGHFMQLWRTQYTK